MSWGEEGEEGDVGDVGDSVRWGDLVRVGASREFRRDELGDLGRVQRGALAQVVAADEQVERVREVERPGAAARRRSGRCRRRRPASGTRLAVGVVESTTPRAPRPAPARASSTLDRVCEDRVHGERVRRDDRHPHAGRRHLQVGDAEDLARLVADLQLLAGPAVVLAASRPTAPRSAPAAPGTARPSPSLSAMARRTSPGAEPSDRSPATTSSSSCSRSMPAWPAPDAAWYDATTSSTQPAAPRAARRARPSSSASCSSGWR